PRQLDPATTAAYDRLYAVIIAPGSGQAIATDLPTPKWQLLAYLVERYPIVLHGSGQPDIDVFEPRQPNDRSEFSNQLAVSASSDGIWPMYFAIVDRDQYPMSLLNGCVRYQPEGGEAGEPHYFFSISLAARVHEPWRDGTVYLLPKASFAHQPPVRV